MCFHLYIWMVVYEFELGNNNYNVWLRTIMVHSMQCWLYNNKATNVTVYFIIRSLLWQVQQNQVQWSPYSKTTNGTEPNGLNIKVMLHVKASSGLKKSGLTREVVFTWVSTIPGKLFVWLESGLKNNLSSLHIITWLFRNFTYTFYCTTCFCEHLSYTCTAHHRVSYSTGM